MFNQLRKVPNQITAIRIVVLPIMWIFALTDARIYLGIGFIISFITDMLDGPIARKLNQTSNFGSKFDSLADQLLQISAILWIYMLMPEVFAENLLITLIALITYITSLAVGLIKYRRFADLHLYLTKLGGVFLYLFVIHALLFGQYNQILYFFAVILLIFSYAECLIFQLISSEVDAHSGSILFKYIDNDHPIRDWLSRLP